MKTQGYNQILIGATIERINLRYTEVGGEKYQWIESFLIRALPPLGGKLYKLTCESECVDDGYGRPCEGSFGVEECQQSPS